jgi:predicted nuclease of predicted toxin-antitoxin system
MKLLVDMNLSPRWLALLQGSKIEAAHRVSILPKNH